MISPVRGLPIILLFRISLLMALCLITPFPTLADELPPASGDVVLVVSGKIKHNNVADSEGNVVELDLAMLEAMEKVSFVTRTPWTTGKTKFEGVRINRLLEIVGAESDSFDAHAQDDYHIMISDIEFDEYPVILAYKIDDEYRSVRDLGPLWIMFPFDDYPELLNEKNKSLAIWQLIKVVVR